MINEFEGVIKSRRSANRFVENVEVSHHDLDEIFALTKYSPSAFNLQHAHYLVVDNRELINKIYELAHRQYKIKTASAVIFVLGNTKAYLEVAGLNEGLKSLGVINEQEYNAIVNQTIQFYEGKGETFQREDAIRNASLSAMQFMLIAKEKGWDTCPLHSLNESIVRELLPISDHLIPVMMITIGQSAPESFRPRGYRKPVNEFVQYYS